MFDSLGSARRAVHSIAGNRDALSAGPRDAIVAPLLPPVWSSRMVSRRHQSATTEAACGLGEKERKAIAEGLSQLLADTCMLSLKTQNYHWNVEGPMYNMLHALFRTQ